MYKMNYKTIFETLKCMMSTNWFRLEIKITRDILFASKKSLAAFNALESNR